MWYSVRMNVSRPHSVISRGVDGDVLRVLTGSVEPLSGREVHRLTRTESTQKTVQAALDRLTEEGLLDVRPQGPSKLYTLNREHLAADSVIELANVRARLLDRLRQQIESWAEKPAHASLFGSAARGDGDATSDIDLLVIRPDQIPDDDPEWREQVEVLAGRVRRWTGNQAGISEMSVNETREMITSEPPILHELRADAIPLFGERFSTFVRSVY
jgi:predicted nucleotidyltransferase